MDRYVEIVKVNYIEPKHEVILGSFLKKLSTAAQPTNKKRNTSNTNNPKKKQKPNHDIRSLFRRAEERRNKVQTAGVSNKSDKQYHEVINIVAFIYGCIYMWNFKKKKSQIIVFFSFFEGYLFLQLASFQIFRGYLFSRMKEKSMKTTKINRHES